MKIKPLLLTALFSLLSFAPARAASASIPLAEGFMHQLIDLAQLSREKGGEDSEESRKLVKTLSDQIDFEGLARLSLPKWSKYTPAQRADFLKTLQELLEKVVYPMAKKISAKKDELHFGTVDGKDNQVRVDGRIEHEKDGEVIQDKIEIVLIYQKAPKIVDAILEGEKISSNLKRQFGEALKKQSFGQIIEKMKKRVHEAKAKS